MTIVLHQPSLEYRAGEHLVFNDQPVTRCGISDEDYYHNDSYINDYLEEETAHPGEHCTTCVLLCMKEQLG